MARPPRFALLHVSVFAFTLIALLSWAAPAAAHTMLVSSDPAAGALLDAEPDAVVLTFAGDVQPAFGDSLRIVDPEGGRANDDRPVIEGDTVTIPITADDVGTYVVDYRVVSSDGHPVNGTFTFSVGERSTPARGALRNPSNGDTMSIMYDVGRALSLLSVLLVAGGGIFALTIVPGWRPVMLGSVLCIGIAMSCVTYVADIALASGLPLGDVVARGALTAEAGTPLGRGMIIRIALEMIALVLLPRLRDSAGTLRPQWFAMVATATFVLLAATQSLTGHALNADSLGLRLPLAMAHSTAAAVWIGGLVQFRLYIIHGAVDLSEVVRFSRTVLGAVVLLVVSGIYAAIDEIGSFADLTGTMYGRLLLFKLVLFASVIPLAAINRRTNIPEIERGARDGRMHLRRYVRAELLLLAAIVAVTVWLVHSPPPSAV